MRGGNLKTSDSGARKLNMWQTVGTAAPNTMQTLMLSIGKIVIRVSESHSRRALWDFSVLKREQTPAEDGPTLAAAALDTDLIALAPALDLRLMARNKFQEFSRLLRRLL